MDGDGNPGCEICHAPSTPTRPTLTCSGCKAAWYCSQDCQRSGWLLGHKAVCAELRDMHSSSFTAVVAGVEVDMRSSDVVSLLREVRSGNLRRCSNLGVCYLQGIGVPRSEAEALRLFELGAAGGDAPSLVCLGKMHKSGLAGLNASTRTALPLFERAAACGNVDGVLEAAQVHLSLGRLSEAAQGFQSALSGGHPAGALSLGIMHYQGEGMPRNIETAKKLLQQAAASNYRAIARHARSMLKGISSSDRPLAFIVNFSSLLKYTEDLSTLPPNMQLDLGLVQLYGREGIGEYRVEADREKGLALLRLAADSGHAPAQYSLGRELDDQALLERAARAGHEDAQVYLGGFLWHSVRPLLSLSTINCMFLTAKHLRRLQEGRAWTVAAAAAGNAMALSIVEACDLTAKRACLSIVLAPCILMAMKGYAVLPALSEEGGSSSSSSSSSSKEGESPYTRIVALSDPAAVGSLHARAAAATLPADGSLQADEDLVPIWQQLHLVQEWLKEAAELTQPEQAETVSMAAAALTTLTEGLQRLKAEAEEQQGLD